jgi:hypothetical protein
MKKKCSVEGCDKPVKCKGVCSYHYNKEYQKNHPEQLRNNQNNYRAKHRAMRLCPSCSQPAAFLSVYCEKHTQERNKAVSRHKAKTLRKRSGFGTWLSVKKKTKQPIVGI